MGQRGKRPAPMKLKLLHGENKSSRLNFDEPPAPNAVPQLPDGLIDDQVREVWEYTLKQLVVMGIASTADRDALLCYCEAVVVHRKASAELANQSLLVGTTEFPARHPAVPIQKESAATIARYAQHFGLSPSARSEIVKGAANSKPAAGAARLLSG
jgi:P27 family predicted phage terminase small subunit